MFERYTQDARRVIFFAYHDARRRGSNYIETGHLLIGLLHERGTRVDRLFGLRNLRKQFKLSDYQLIKSFFSTKQLGDIPLSNASKRALAYTVEEAARLNSEPIDTEHLLLGLLREKESDVPNVLASAGINLDSARNRIMQDLGLPGSAKEPNEKQHLTPAIAFVLLVLVIGVLYAIVKMLSQR